MLIPYYDARAGNKGFSFYNLVHVGDPEAWPNIQPLYHQYHTMLIWALDGIAPHPTFNRTWRTWASYVDQPLREPPSIQITRAQGAVVVSWEEPGTRLQMADTVGQWRDAPWAGDARSVLIPTVGSGLFFRLIK